MHLHKAGYFVLITCFVCLTAFCVWYLASSYDALKTAYLSLNDCFYHSSLWTIEFFTPTVKVAGNRWCTAALVISLLGILLSLRDFRKQGGDTNRIVFQFNIEIVITVLIAFGLAFYSYNYISPAYDEIFSAVNVADLPSFQAWSYYMLPNNHVLFNVINGLVFAASTDHVMTGRWLSIIAYILTAVVILKWLNTIVKSPLLRVVFVILLLVQLPVWGFSAQARGYGWQLFAGWSLFVYTISYWQTNDKSHLIAIMWSIWLGYALIPSFLHFHLTIVMYAVLVQLYQRRVNISFWKYQCYAGNRIFLFYLPALCFSGYNAFADNRYVAMGVVNLKVFMPEFLSVFKYYVKYCFAFLLGEGNKISYALFAIPLLLIFSKDKNKKWLSVFYSVMWVVFIVLVLYMKRIPFSRNLTIHFSITLAMVAYAMFVFLYWLGEKIHAPVLSPIILTLLCATMCWHFMATYPKNAISLLYFNPANDIYAFNTQSIKAIPNDATVYCSPESFYWRYLRVRQNLPANYCQTGQEQYLVKRVTGELSPIDTTGYRKIQTFPDEYELWQKQ